jgi:hypothetical protein
MDIEVINDRIDHALQANRRAERIITGLAVAIFSLGAGSLLVAYWQQNPYIAGGTVLLQASVDTSKPAIGGQAKTGQRGGRSRPDVL